MWEVAIYFSLLSLNLLIWATSYRHLQPASRLLGLGLLLTLVVEGFAAYLMFHNIRNLYLYHFLTPLQYALFALVFYKVLTGTRLRQAVLASLPLYLAASTYFTLCLEGLSEYNSYALSLKNVLIVCWALGYYKEVFESLQVTRLTHEPMFWVSTGLFFYSLGSFFVDGLMNQLLSDSFELASALYYISIFLEYLLYITFLIAFVLERKASQYALE
ncbi:hypothetical protein [Pontibacter liquoris]|uniref:hypothetical protein n=1 Tax=Pontibacter liquoris TaxID=2905677 RepID=UPI001FA7B3FF|nr:hypothetical protein [Pontibacter liquoris]